jgi:hypothetical protein
MTTLRVVVTADLPSQVGPAENAATRPSMRLQVGFFRPRFFRQQNVDEVSVGCNAESTSFIEVDIGLCSVPSAEPPQGAQSLTRMLDAPPRLSIGVAL